MPSLNTQHSAPSTPRILSGVQPTGNLHLGNYLGAIRNWVSLQNSHECLFMLADLHAITVPQDPEKLRSSVRETAAAYIACGIDPEKSAIFHQSAVAAHAELAWILSCHTPMGWLNRMTQFKEKAQAAKIGAEEQNKKIENVIKKYLEGDLNFAPINIVKFLNEAALKDQQNIAEANLGLYAYPVLMASDILVYKATHVPVGHDQKQHLELCRDIAGAFNRAYPPLPPGEGRGEGVAALKVPHPNPLPKGEGNRGFFPLPEPVIMGEGTRVMSLKDGSKKMSKSDESDLSRINLTDDSDAIAKKFKKATSDSFPTVGENNASRPEASNLVGIYAALKGITREAALAEVGDKQFSAFKQMLTDVAVEHLSPITRTMRELIASPDFIDQVLAKGVAKAQEISGQTMKEVKELVGFLPG